MNIAVAAAVNVSRTWCWNLTILHLHARIVALSRLNVCFPRFLAPPLLGG